MSQTSFEPPYSVEVDGRVKHEDIPSEERALVLAQDFVRRNPGSKVEIFDHNREQVFVSQSRRY